MNKQTKLAALAALAIGVWYFFIRKDATTGQTVAQSGKLANGVVFGMPKPAVSNAVNGNKTNTQVQTVPVAGAGSVYGVDLSKPIAAGVGAVVSGVGAAVNWFSGLFSGSPTTSDSPVIPGVNGPYPDPLDTTTTSDPLIPGVNGGYDSTTGDYESSDGDYGPAPAPLQSSASRMSRKELNATRREKREAAAKARIEKQLAKGAK